MSPRALQQVERAARAALETEIRTARARRQLSQMHHESRMLVGTTVVLLAFALVGVLVLLAGG